MTNRKTKQITHHKPSQNQRQNQYQSHNKIQTQTFHIGSLLLPISYKQIAQNIIVTMLVISTLILAASPITFAGNNLSTKEYNINSKKKIETVIGAGLLNRIHIDFATIMEVVGDESKYSIHWSGDYRNLFIFPKVEVGETIEVSFIMSAALLRM